MATETMKKNGTGQEERPSGVPGPHQLGAARRELWYVLIAIVVFALIALSFWFESTN